MSIDQLNNPVNDSLKIEKWFKTFDFQELWESGLFSLYLRSLTTLDKGVKLPKNIYAPNLIGLKV